ncbi:MAG TPA: hypothetical protein PKE29_17365 [Phycisphaerales bacterium]|mgnify:CR=1 FL=1|nr:hypothetical protein [Phycisphaerales bacterium]
MHALAGGIDPSVSPLAMSMPGVPMSELPEATPVMLPISWLAGVLVKVPLETLMTPLKEALMPAR